MVKSWVITGVCLIGAGVLCCTAAIGAGALNQQRYREKLHLTDRTDTPSENFTAIQVALEDADLTVQTGESVSVEAENISADCYDVTVRDGVLRIEQRSNDLNQYTLIHLGGFSIPTAKITLTLPEENYKSMNISASYGDCTVDGISAQTFSANLDCGDGTFQNISTENYTAKSSYGDLQLSDSEVKDSLSVEADSGSVTFARIDIRNRCQVQDDFGDVEMNAVTCGVAEMTLDSGSLTVNRFECTDEDASSIFTLDFGDFICIRSKLWNSDISLDSGDIRTEKTALYGATTINLDFGSASLNLLGTSGDYSVGHLLAGGTVSGGGNVISISGDSDANVTFTEVP